MCIFSSLLTLSGKCLNSSWSLRLSRIFPEDNNTFSCCCRALVRLCLVTRALTSSTCRFIEFFHLQCIGSMTIVWPPTLNDFIPSTCPQTPLIPSVLLASKLGPRVGTTTTDAHFTLWVPRFQISVESNSFQQSGFVWHDRWDNMASLFLGQLSCLSYHNTPASLRSPLQRSTKAKHLSIAFMGVLREWISPNAGLATVKIRLISKNLGDLTQMQSLCNSKRHCLQPYSPNSISMLDGNSGTETVLTTISC